MDPCSRYLPGQPKIRILPPVRLCFKSCSISSTNSSKNWTHIFCSIHALYSYSTNRIFALCRYPNTRILGRLAKRALIGRANKNAKIVIKPLSLESHAPLSFPPFPFTHNASYRDTLSFFHPTPNPFSAFDPSRSLATHLIASFNSSHH